MQYTKSAQMKQEKFKSHHRKSKAPEGRNPASSVLRARKY